MRTALVSTFVLGLASVATWAQVEKTGPYPSASGSVTESGEIRTLPSADAGRIDLSSTRNGAAAARVSPKEDTCLLPPLNLTAASTVSTAELGIPAKAKKKYQQACTALKDKKTADAEKDLRAAVEAFPKYCAAWVTLGQMLAAEQHIDEARKACLQGSTADSSYAPADLCLADIAARAHDWDEVLKRSSHALDLDPSNNAVAYEYHAAANLNLHHLAEAEKSGLRAAEIDKDHREPRVYFVLAQVYEAKGDSASEVQQLREYLKYAKDPDDIAMVNQYLADLEKQTRK